MEFVRIEPGNFVMGHDGSKLPDNLLDPREPDGERRAWLRETGDYDEVPAHTVTISNASYVGVHEVTNQQYEEFDPLHTYLRGKLGFSIDDDEAVVFVSWHEAQAFCDWLSRKEGLPYRLPTEAEWEYACRAGTTTLFSTGDALPDDYLRNPSSSWYPDLRRGRGRDEVVPLHVGGTPANPWGIHDMHGNVEEWCLDWYGPYEEQPQTDPVGRADGDFKVTRGGSHSTFAYYLRSANRIGTLPEDTSWYIGFRVVIGEMPRSAALPPIPPPPCQQDVRQRKPRRTAKAPDP
ncbi:MAG: formylglycine-generating enzyme family protein, partial [Armatimonadota bacterium]